MTKPGNWNRNPWNRNKPRLAPDTPNQGQVMGRIVAERIRQQCSQAWLAEKTGWSSSAVNRYERGQDRVPLAFAEAAAQALGLRVVALWDGEARDA